jgi:hypothetical protein
MLKVHYQTDQEELFKACGGHMSQLIETERGVKSAASELISRDIVERFRPDDDHFLIHNIAMGDTETYGANRNADAWSKKALTDKHQTFVTHGHLFREHRNRDPKDRIGTIKYAAFDGGPDGMHRVELLCWGHKKKAAEEYELARSGKELSFSMSARVPGDVCSCCGHFSKSAAEYCDHIKKHALQYLPEFKKYAFVDNPDPTFFDNSRVRNPADRIAHYLEYRFPDDEQLQKAASANNQVILGVEWAQYEGLAVPDARYDLSPALHKLASRLADLETEVRLVQEKSAAVADSRAQFIKAAAGQVLDPDGWDDQDLARARAMRPGTLARNLAKRAALLPFNTFAAYALNTPLKQTLSDPLVKAASRCLPGIMSEILSTGVEPGLLGLMKADDRFTAGCDPCPGDLIQGLMSKADQAFGLSPEVAKQRMTIIISSGSPKSASTDVQVDDRARNLAQAYGAYQLQALSDMEKISSTAVDDKILLQVVLENLRSL